MKRKQVEWKVLHNYSATVEVPDDFDDMDEEQQQEWFCQKLIHDGHNLNETEIDEELQYSDITFADAEK